MSITLALMPDPSGVPRGAQWTQLADGALQSTSGSTEVYDLTWTESTSRGMVFNKFRFFVDPETRLPRRVEFYQKRFADEEYSLTSVKQVEYISDAEMEAVIGEVFP
jgi:hypothetical protein